jgi:HEPN domain-containing protein
MAPDEARREDVRAWLQKAALDLRAAQHGMSAPQACLRSDVVFHAQQAAEKAFLAWHDVPFRKTHNLEELSRACVSLDGTLGVIVDRAAPLTEYAWRFRYPGEPSREEVDEALSTAREVLEVLASRLPKNVQP